MFRRTHGLAFAHAIAVAHDTTARCSRGATAKTPLPTLHSLKDSRYASQVISDAFPGTADSIRRSGVAEKPHAAAIRAETCHRELIVTGSARSVGRGATVRPRDGAGDDGGARREPPAGVGVCVHTGGVRRQRAPRHRLRRAPHFAAARSGSRQRPRAPPSAARRCSRASVSARLRSSFQTPPTLKMRPGTEQPATGIRLATGRLRASRQTRQPSAIPV